MARSELVLRPYEDADEEPVLRLLGRSLGKEPDDRYRAFFRWKHLENPFGRSFAWVAESDGQLAGFRTFMRWRFVGPDGTVEAVRAVDTATDPDHRGAGVFRRLTEHGLEQLEAAGVDLVFNTPNDQSRPGYLKMGWALAGRAVVQVRPRSPLALVRLARARTAATLWSEPTTVGTAADEALAAGSLDELVERVTPGDASDLRTDRSSAFLRWRYAGFPPVSSRVAMAGDEIADGLVLFRLRRRGAALECTVGDLLVPDPGRGAAVARRVLADSGADYALVGAPAPDRLRGFVATDRLGPMLTWRAPGGGGTPPSLRLALGDLELF